MAKPVTPYQAPELADGDVVLYPLRPFGKGYVLDADAHRRLKREGVYWALLALCLCAPAPFLIVVVFGVYVARVRRHAYRRVPAIPLRTSAKLQAQQTSRLLSGIIVIGCSVVAGVLGDALGEVSTFSDALLWLALIGVVSLTGMYATWMFRVRARARRGWW